MVRRQGEGDACGVRCAVCGVRDEFRIALSAAFVKPSAF